ncbi:MAG: integrase core domain-containing protein [Pseudomonas sp.]
MGRQRNNSLSANELVSLDDVRSRIEAWRRDYNNFRYHSSPSGPSPASSLTRSETGSRIALTRI